MSVLVSFTCLKHRHIVQFPVLKGHLECLKCGKTVWRPGLRPGPRWGSLQRSTDLLAGGDGAFCSLPKNPTPLGRSGLQPWPLGPRHLPSQIRLPKSAYECSIEALMAVMLLLLLVCEDVPQGTPRVEVKETTPNMVILEVDPPLDNGGKEVTGYRVEYDRKMTDYAVGLLAVIIIIIIIIITCIVLCRPAVVISVGRLLLGAC